MKKRFLVLADGHVFEGTPFGASGSALGELVFTTGMGGYIETLTDPSYYGQIILQTFPLIGNYGMNTIDCESRRPFAKAYIVREWCDAPSNFRCEETVDAYLKRHGIVGLCSVDTREITRLIRDKGVMNAVITDSPDTVNPNALQNYAVTDAVKNVSVDKIETIEPEGKALYHVVLIDYGAKRNICRELLKRGCRVTIVPHSVTSTEVLALDPDGVMLSNGPGDPAENKDEIAALTALTGRVPIFGICLGHQLLALACGGKTEKLKFGHRGVNQPVHDLESGRTYITSQNHGYAVSADTLPAGAYLRYVNANDHTCEGLDYPSKSAFSVQFHPEASSGPHDTEFLFNRFLALMKEGFPCR